MPEKEITAILEDINAMIVENFHSSHEISFKSDESIVTKTDREVEEILIQRDKTGNSGREDGFGAALGDLDTLAPAKFNQSVASSLTPDTGFSSDILPMQEHFQTAAHQPAEQAVVAQIDLDLGQNTLGNAPPLGQA